jgi:ergothioneine biosynthesis protein EgtB
MPASGTETRSRPLRARFLDVRARTEALAAPLTVEDQVVQSMPDASPVKWHLAHTTWFFERFVLKAAKPRWEAILNSYYDGVGPQFDRASRGVLSRPTVAEVALYRREVDARLAERLERPLEPATAALVELGLAHEEQHQELILTDLLHAFSRNPLRPAYRDLAPPVGREAEPPRWLAFEGGLVEIGASGRGFAFDNERPRHRVYLEPFELGSRLVTAGEFLAFIEDKGYERPELWPSDGWAARRQHGWTAPLYWEKLDGRFHVMTLGGLRPLTAAEPVCHLSWYEASAFARFSGARLPREEEWEVAAAREQVAGNFVESGALQPRAAAPGATQLFGDAWEWTASPYTGYPGFRAFEGVVGEYNGKFMCNQLVLRGGSCATPADHARATYRNFFPPAARWQFAGLRLARDA